MRLGIDFGTTRTVVALADRGNYPVLSFLDDAGDSHEWFPSVVAERKGQLSFGFEALTLEADGAHLVRSFKRFLSDPHAVPSTPARVGELVLPLGDLLTRYLLAVKDAIRARSNLASEFKDTPSSQVRTAIAVPAHAHGAQRFLTLDCFRRAGLAPVAMLNEPSAAGFEFTHRHRKMLTSRRDHVVVYDLGGGTFDASLIRMRGRHHEVLATGGVNELGGNEFDEILLTLVLDRLGLKRGELRASALGRLLDQCREAKERLSPASRKLAIDLDSALGDLAPTPEMTLSVGDFYDACESLVQRTIDTMLPVMDRLEGAEDDDDAAPRSGSGDVSAIAGIYVVGGASSLPNVARALRQRFGRRVHRSPYASAAVAIGLAIACDETAGFELSDQYARTFGVFREGAAGLEITFDPIFTSETRVPVRQGGQVKCRRTYRAAHNIGHYRFLECSAIGSDGRPRGDMVYSGDVLFPFDPSLREGAIDLAAVPVERIPDSGPRIEEEYALDEHGLVAVTIRNVDANYQRVYHVGG